MPSSETFLIPIRDITLLCQVQKLTRVFIPDKRFWLKRKHKDLITVSLKGRQSTDVSTEAP